MKIEGWRARWLVAIGHRLLQTWGRTLRFEIDDRAGLLGTPPNERYIGALWHNRLLFIPYVVHRFLPQRHGAALISTSRDGALIADLVERFGFAVVRGSTSRKGAAAVRQLADLIADGLDAVITPDGPRGPAYHLGRGIIFLAQLSGAAVIPLNMEFSSCWRAKSWDRFILPKPFSRVRVIFGPPHAVMTTSSEEEFERERLRLEETMMQLVEMR
ncbi:MAG TPA: lysophospholipid acyltransferase family protein [Chthoniobacterales bacterium]|jgi:hypothetical protein